MSQAEKTISENKKNGCFRINKDKNGQYASAFDWADSIVISVFIIILIFTFFFRMVGVKGESMRETLQNKDHVVITNFDYTPSDGDIVVVSRAYLTDENGNSAEPIIKRVIATEGQTVDIRTEQDGINVYVDGVKKDEPYIREAMREYYQTTVNFPCKIEKGHVFVMGDNRNNSRDSRSFDIGPLDVRYILGRAVLRLYPFTVFN